MLKQKINQIVTKEMIETIHHFKGGIFYYKKRPRSDFDLKWKYTQHLKKAGKRSGSIFFKNGKAAGRKISFTINRKTLQVADSIMAERITGIRHLSENDKLVPRPDLQLSDEFGMSKKSVQRRKKKLSGELSDDFLSFDIKRLPQNRLMNCIESEVFCIDVELALMS